jgi:hypothetical protein
MEKEAASERIIRTLAKFVRNELSDIHSQIDARLDRRDKELDARLTSIDDNLAQHMKRTAILECCRENDSSSLKRNTETMERLLPILARYEAFETAAKWIYKPVSLGLVALAAWAVGAKGEFITEILKKMVGM